MIDILSLVGLSVEILSRHESDSVPSLTGAEALGVARWHEGDGRERPAESAFLAAVESDDEEVRVDALRHWTAHLSYPFLLMVLNGFSTTVNLLFSDKLYYF